MARIGSSRRILVMILAALALPLSVGSAGALGVADARGVVVGTLGVERVILWNGVDAGFLDSLRAVTPYDLVHRYEIISGAAVAVRSEAVDRVVSFARARGLKAARDRIVHAMLDRSTKTVHVKKAGQAWSLGYTGGGVSIAVLDTGIDAAHVSLNDLDDNLATTDPKVIAFRDCTKSGCPAATAFDDNGHGSHVAGIAAGTGDGPSGDGPRGHRYVGVAYEANLVGLKVLNANGSGSSSNIIAAIDWAAQNANSVSPPIRILSMSFGSVLSVGSNDGTDPEDVAVDNATAAGLVSTIAAGNGSSNGLTPNITPGNVAIPGDAKTAITVCSSDSADPPAQPTFSEWDSEGPTADGRIKPDLCAPGESVTSVRANTTNGYVAFGGTSMATPHVAGIAALVIQAAPGITPAQLKDVLARTASHYGTGQNNDSGWGEAYAKEAIELAISLYGGAPQPLVARANGPYAVAQSETKVLTATATGGLPPSSFSWDLDGDGVFGDAALPTATFTNSSTLGAKTVRVRVTDSASPANVSTDTTTVQVLAPVTVFSDDVESGANGWAAASDGAATAAGWHQESFYSKSPTRAWYAGNDATRVYTNNEDVSLTRTFELSAGAAASSGQILLKFGMSGTLEKTFDFLRVNVRPSGSATRTELARYDDTTATAWAAKTLDITSYRGQVVDVSFRFTSDEFNPPADATDTGPFVDDIAIIGTESPAADTTPPVAVADLAAGSATRTGLTLTWTAPGDDGNSGTAASYDLRHAPSPITESNFALASPVSGVPVPKPAGSAESMIVTSLSPGTTYYFAVKAADEVNNVAAVSNVASGTTLPPDTTPPSTVTGLTATPGNQKVTLGWNAATDDTGVDHFVVYQSGVDVLHPTATSATIAGLANGVTYTFEVSAVDAAGNEGPRSAAVTATPQGPVAAISPTSLMFGSQDVGTSSAPQSVTVENTGTDGLSVSSASVVGGDFAKSGDACSGTVLAAGNSCLLQVTFSPLFAGTRTGTLSIVTDAPGSPHAVSLSGTGIGTPVASVTPTSVSFGDVFVGRTSDGRGVSVRNAGSAPLVVGSVTIGGADAARFSKSIDLCGGATLQPGGTCSIGLVFQPDTARAFAATLEIVTNAAGSPHAVALSGTGIQDVSPPVSTFSTQSGSILIGGLSQVAGSTTDDLAGVSRLTMTMTPSAGSPRTVYPQLTCDASRTSCTWRYPMPLAFKGPVRVEVYAGDAAGNVESPPVAIDVLVV